MQRLSQSTAKFKSISSLKQQNQISLWSLAEAHIYVHRKSYPNRSRFKWAEVNPKQSLPRVILADDRSFRMMQTIQSFSFNYNMRSQKLREMRRSTMEQLLKALLRWLTIKEKKQQLTVRLKMVMLCDLLDAEFVRGLWNRREGK